MENLHAIAAHALDDTQLRPQDLPGLDLYMDQILTLFDEGLSENKRRPEEKLLTKTMINNYSKERLILPVKGKKYSRAQVIQMLCILNLKQNLPLADIRALMQGMAKPEDFEAAYADSLALKERLRERLPELLEEWLGTDRAVGDSKDRLAIILALSSGGNFLRRICEGILDGE